MRCRQIAILSFQQCSLYLFSYQRIQTYTMSITHAVQKITELHNNKKLRIEQIAGILEQTSHLGSNILLSQKMSMVAIILHFLFIATKSWSDQIVKFRHEICYEPVKTAKERINRNVSTTKKKKERLASNKENNLTVDQILVSAIKQGMSQVSNSKDLMTPRREAIIFQNKATTIPPFEASIIAQLSQDQSVLSKQLPKTFNRSITDQKMMTYLKILDFDQKEGEEPSVIGPRLEIPPNKPQRTLKKRNTIKLDKNIDLKQDGNIINNLQALTTKMRMVRQLQNLNSFQDKIKSCNPVLTNNSAIIQKLAQKVKRKRQRQSIQQHQINMQVQMRSLSEYNNQIEDPESKFILNEQNNPSITQAIQSKLTHILSNQLFVQEKVSFQEFSQKRKIQRDIKAQLFYQLLHMDFPLQQSKPQSFGQILIGNKQSY